MKIFSFLREKEELWRIITNRDSVLQGNIGLGQVTRSVCRGVMENLAGMMGPEMLRLRGIQRIVGSGACLIRQRSS